MTTIATATAGCGDPASGTEIDHTTRTSHDQLTVPTFYGDGVVDQQWQSMAVDSYGGYAPSAIALPGNATGLFYTEPVRLGGWASFVSLVGNVPTAMTRFAIPSLASKLVAIGASTTSPTVQLMYGRTDGHIGMGFYNYQTHIFSGFMGHDSAFDSTAQLKPGSAPAGCNNASLNYFWRDPNDHLHAVWSLNGSTMRADVASGVTGSPTAVCYGSSNPPYAVEVFWRGSNGHIHRLTPVPIPPYWYEVDVGGNVDDDIGAVMHRGEGNVTRTDLVWTDGGYTKHRHSTDGSEPYPVSNPPVYPSADFERQPYDWTGSEPGVSGTRPTLAWTVSSEGIPLLTIYRFHSLWGTVKYLDYTRWVGDRNPTSAFHDVPLVAQQQTNWCWLASTQMVTNFFHLDWTQCQIANAVHSRYPLTSPYSSWGMFVDCCANPSACNTGGWPNDAMSSLGLHYSTRSASIIWNGTQWAWQAPYMSASEIQSQIQQGKPVIFGWNWDSGGAHAEVIKDFLGNTSGLNGASAAFVVLNDPWPPYWGDTAISAWSEWIYALNGHSMQAIYYDISP